MSVRRNNIQGTNKVTWGFLGKRTSYVNQSFERVPELTEEERREKLVENLNSWSVSKTKKRIDFAPIEDNYARGGTDSFAPEPQPSPTPQPTPTPSPTPLPACDFDYEYVATASISPTGTTLYNFQSLSGTSNLVNASYFWTLQGFYDYSGNSITNYTGETTPIGEFRETGDTLVSLSVVGEGNWGNTFTATTNDFSVGIPTTYRMFFGSRGTTDLYYTDDLVNFSSTTTPDSFNGFGYMAYSPKLDMYAVGIDNDVMYSYDGLSWSATNDPSIFNARYNNMVWADKLGIFVSVGDRSNYVVISNDGVNWTRYGTFGFGDLGTSPLIWDSVNELLILHDGDGDAWTSSDGITWSLVYSYSGTRFGSIVNYEGRTSVVFSFNNGAYYGDDGLNWSGATFINEQTNRQTWSICNTPSGRIIGTGSGQNGGGGFCISDDGIIFSGITAPTEIITENQNSTGAIYNIVEGKVLAPITNSNKLLNSSDEGLTYTTQVLPATNIRATLIRYNI